MSEFLSLPQLQNLATQDATQYGVPTNLFLAQINQESGFNPSASNGNALGIAQFEPQTAQSFGIDPTNPVQSLQAAAQYDSQLYSKTGSWTQALQGYGTLPNSGPLSSGQQSVASIAGLLDQQQGNEIDQVLGIPGISSMFNSGSATASGQSVSLGAWLEEFGIRAALIVIGLVFLLGGFVLIGKNQSAGRPAFTGA